MTEEQAGEVIQALRRLVELGEGMAKQLDRLEEIEAGVVGSMTRLADLESHLSNIDATLDRIEREGPDELGADDDS